MISATGLVAVPVSCFIDPITAGNKINPLNRMMYHY